MGEISIITQYTTGAPDLVFIGIATATAFATVADGELDLQVPGGSIVITSDPVRFKERESRLWERGKNLCCLHYRLEQALQLALVTVIVAVIMACRNEGSLWAIVDAYCARSDAEY